jgi:acyl-coenzyme A synthetase/AMP-(fatty) acid ligase
VNITDGLFRQARKTPDAPAVLTPQSCLTYAELANAISFNAARLQRDGLAPGDTVAIALSSQLQHLVVSLALARLGAAQLALHPGDPPALRRDLERRLSIATTIAAQPPESPAELARLPATPFAAADDASLPFLVKRSSGTMADAPKLAVLTHGMAHSWLYDFVDTLPEGPGHRFLSLISVTFTGAVHGVLRCLSLGACLALPEGITGYAALVEFIRRQRIDYLAGGPVHVAGFRKIAAGSNAILLPQVKAFRVSTTLIPEPVRKAIRERLTPTLFIFYGTTEVGALTLATPELVARVPGVVGFPVRGVEIQVVDAEGRQVPAGRTGLVRARSAGMIREYLDDPAETARVFRDGWFHSSDLAEFTPEGALIHHGRADDLMIFDGINIHPAEIESALLKHAAVAEAAAFPVKSLARGDVPHAAVVLKGETKAGKTKARKPGAAELLAHCRSWLGARSPSSIAILRELPRNAAGKVLRRELEALCKASATS